MPTEHATRIALVDDDPDMRGDFTAYLETHGFAVDEIDDVEEFRELLVCNKPDLMLLDLDFQGTSVFDLVRFAREICPSMGIVIVSDKSDVIDRVAGLEAGADDFVEKPFHARELLARMRSVLRRNDAFCFAAEAPNGADPAETHFRKILPTNGDTIRFCGWTLDRNARTLVSTEGRHLELTSGTFDLLTAFAVHPNRVLSREQLLDLVGNGEVSAFDRSIDVQVGRLRRLIEPNPKRPAIIKTVRNAGYVLAADGAMHAGAC